MTTTRRSTTTTTKSTTTTTKTTSTTERSTTTMTPRTTTTERTTSLSTTSSGPASTLSAILVEAVSPRPVQCWSCGSLFSTDAPDCSSFNSRDPAQVQTCAQGEACLYYSWKKSATESSVIRECFPTSILLGSIDNPVQPQVECSLTSLESDSISACICTSDLCNGVGDDDINTELRPKVAVTTRSTITTTTITTTVTTSTTTARTAVTGRVKCHQCGSLFSGSSSSP